MKNIAFVSVVLFSICIQSVSALEAGFISGMEEFKPDSYLVVADKKGDEDGYRVGILKTKNGSKLEFSPLKITDWKHSDGQASDLESACRVPGKSNEFLLAESGYWERKYGRIFHIEINTNGALVKNVFHIPGSKDGVDGDNFEGMVCIEKDDSIFVILGERGESSSYKNGYLRIGILDYSNSQLSWSKYSNNPVEIVAPGHWNNPQSKRSISDLYLDKQGVIWAVATEDAENDEGPFRSIIYKAALVSSSKPGTFPVVAINPTKAQWVIDGFKIEALAGPSTTVPNSYMSIGSEDESYGGVWRPLFSPIE
uniref:Esterase-like activity of phytase n=1 Tax=Candidatus Kentrum sp. LFY TaxID=2126342 RepID=A0A450UIE4_9GAMM|nr:MAG: Esterase-like activity of phytase [Candidatus Kentron sp. LFY]